MNITQRPQPRLADFFTPVDDPKTPTGLDMCSYDDSWAHDDSSTADTDSHIHIHAHIYTHNIPDAFQTIRLHSLAHARSLGFRPPTPLPHDSLSLRTTTLRPLADIRLRMNALCGLVLWCGPHSLIDIDSASVRQSYGSISARQELWGSHFTPEESVWFSTARESLSPEVCTSVGWRMESMWALAWVLGFPLRPPHIGRASGSVCINLLRFASHPTPSNPNPSSSPNPSSPNPNPVRSSEAVAGVLDVFEVLLAAVRRAETHAEMCCVPERFHLVSDGRAVRERCCALRWALSPGMCWDEVMG